MKKWLLRPAIKMWSRSNPKLRTYSLLLRPQNDKTINIIQSYKGLFKKVVGLLTYFQSKNRPSKELKSIIPQPSEQDPKVGKKNYLEKVCGCAFYLME